MNIDEAWRQLSQSEGFPQAALSAILADWDAAAPRLIAKLRAYAGGAKFSDDDLNALFFAIHLCAEKRDERAYAPLCAILERDAEIETWFGDALSATLPGALINLCDGDGEPLRRIYENPRADEWARWSALLALAYLTRARGALGDDDMRAHLRRIGENLRQEGSDVAAAAWAMAVGMLGYDDMSGEVARAFARGFVGDEISDFKNFHHDLSLARSTPDGLEAFHKADIAPFADVVETLRPLCEPGEEGIEDDGAPYVNPFRDVGRNDPCPCGSGKKYKKCCLAA